jgi:hypothetical protein
LAKGFATNGIGAAQRVETCAALFIPSLDGE